MGFSEFAWLNKNRKNISLFLLLWVCMGCQDSFQSAVQQTDPIRKQLGLKTLDSLTQDSTAFVTPLSDTTDYYFIQSKNQKPGDSFTKVIYYSNKKKNFSKRLLFKSVANEITLLIEEDRYEKNVDTFRNAALCLAYYYKNKESYARIDSFPTQRLLQRNKKALEKIYQESKNSKGSLCGTGLREIKTKDFPKKLRIITNEEFKKLIPSYTQQPKIK